jgi:threonine dehydrogenase-like Zn-dependent dehydrogenase
VIRLAASCICGSDLWPYRGIASFDGPMPVGHEYVGVVEEVGSQVRDIHVGDFVVGPFVAAGDDCEICRAGFQSYCTNRVEMPTIGVQAERARMPFADQTLIATPKAPDPDLIPSLLTASDVFGTGWFAAVSAGVGPRTSVAVVGDGAVGLMGVLAHSSLVRSASSPSAGTPPGRTSPDTSAPPTLSRSGATKGRRRSSN